MNATRAIIFTLLKKTSTLRTLRDRKAVAVRVRNSYERFVS